METISLSDFQKVDIRIGKIIEAEKVEGSEKLLKLLVDFGEEKRQIVSGIAAYYQPEAIIGRLCPFVFNLEPKVLKGIESQGMIVCADDGQPVLLYPDREVSLGSKLK